MIAIVEKGDIQMVSSNKRSDSRTDQSDNLAVSFDQLMQAVKAQQKIFKTTPDRLFGYILLLFRTELELNQEDMGRMLGLSKSSYNKFENGSQSINISHVFLLSHLTNVPRSFIYSLHDHLATFTHEHGGWFMVEDQFFSPGGIESKHPVGAEDQMNLMKDAIYTPLRDYLAFFGVDHVAHIAATINQAIKNGGKLEPRKS